MHNLRKPFQGVLNIIRFNWHYYVLSLTFVTIILLTVNQFNTTLQVVASTVVLLIVFTTLTSLAVSFYIYDLSDLYRLSWLDILKSRDKEKILNINAGFDETSNLLQHRFPGSELMVADFYDPEKHTEVSIKRARRAYPSYENTKPVATNHLPLPDNSMDKIFAILSAHEIRNADERVTFFKELSRTLAATGRIIVTEHLRDTANFLAYNIGFLHFHSKSTWLKTFKNAGLIVSEEIKVTRFITTFILVKNGTAS